MGKHERDPLFFREPSQPAPPDLSEAAWDEEESLPEPDPRMQQKRLGLLLALAAIGLVLFAVFVKRDTLRGFFAGSVAEPESEILRMPPQQGAEKLLARAAAGSAEALALVEQNAEAWRGRIAGTPELRAAENRALESGDYRVRSAAVEVHLAANNLPKSPESVTRLIREAQPGGSNRAWSLLALGMLANRRVETDRVREVLLSYLHDPNEQVRYWAVGGLAFIGNEDVVAPLLAALRSDPAPDVRKQAGMALGRGGMLRPELRRQAVPELISMLEDTAVDAETRAWAHQALVDITGKKMPPDVARWRAWQQQQP
jgi:HEAT repeat protein